MLLIHVFVPDIMIMIAKKYMNKEFNPSYLGARLDVLDLIAPGTKNVLDVGCSVGELGKSIKKKTGATITGVEYNSEMAKEASYVLDCVIQKDAEMYSYEARQKKEQYDCIIFADILEHLNDPWVTIANYSNCLTSNGYVVVSIPNVRHIDTLFNLCIRGKWPYRERGIHDKTHLRFFTLKNIEELINQAGLEICLLKRNLRICEVVGKPINKFSHLFNISGLRELFTFQYLIVAVKKQTLG